MLHLNLWNVEIESCWPRNDVGDGPSDGHQQVPHNPCARLQGLRHHDDGEDEDVVGEPRSQPPLVPAIADQQGRAWKSDLKYFVVFQFVQLKDVLFLYKQQ